MSGAPPPASDAAEDDTTGDEARALGSSRLASVSTPNSASGRTQQAVLPHQNNQELSPNNQFTPEVQYFKQSDALKQKIFKDLDMELDMTLKELSKRKPPVAPRKPYREPSPNSMSDSDQDTPKTSSIMAKVSKFEYYAKQQKIGRSQFYTNENVDYSPKVFSSNSLTVNTPAKDVLGGKNAPTVYKNCDRKMVVLNEYNPIDAKSCSYANVMIKNKISKIDDMVRNFDDVGVNLKKVNNIENERLLQEHLNNREAQLKQELYTNQIKFKDSNESKIDGKFSRIDQNYQMKNEKPYSPSDDPTYGRIEPRRDVKFNKPSPSFDRNPQMSPTLNVSSHMERNDQAEQMRLQAYKERIEEQKQREVENARLEEILSICAEYERQGSTGTPSTPTEKRSQNKIITNGSLPRSIINNPNFIQTSDGYFKFDTSQNRAQNLSKSLPSHRNVSQYDNLDFPTSPRTSPNTSQVRNPSSYENVERLDEIGIPVNDDISSPITIKKFHEALSPKSSPYENVFYVKPPFKPQSPNTSSPRTRIKTTFAHKNVSPPQYFVFPTPPPIEDDSKKIQDGFNYAALVSKVSKNNQVREANDISKGFVGVNESATENAVMTHNANVLNNHTPAFGIEKQLSLNEEIPMIDDEMINHLESRSSQIMSRDISPEKAVICDTSSTNMNSLRVIHDTFSTSSDAHLKFNNINMRDTICADKDNYSNTKNYNCSGKVENSNTKDDYKVKCDNSNEIPDNIHKVEFDGSDSTIRKFDDVKRELKADIPELEQFERDLADNKREQLIRKLAHDVRNINERPDSEISASDVMSGLKIRYDDVRDARRKLLSEIHELKVKMSVIRTQEDDILRELEMEKALIKGEYDSEIAILKIEQKSKKDLQDKAKTAEDEIQAAKTQQEERQKELKERVDVASAHVERLEESYSSGNATSEELQNARDILENETKLYEDLEFQHLEAESEMLAYREDLQNQIMNLTKKIESQKTRILTLKAEANDNLTSALDETRVLQSEYKKLLTRVEELTNCVQKYERELKDIGTQINADRPQSPLSIYSENMQEDKDISFSSDSEEINFDTHQKHLNDKFSSIDQMSQSMIVDLGEKRQINDLIDSVTMVNISEIQDDKKFNIEESKEPKEKKGFWERNFDSLSRLKRRKSQKSDIMSQSLNENMFFNNDNIESDYTELQKFGSMKKKKKTTGASTPVKSSTSKIPTLSSLGRIIKKDSFKKSELKDKKTHRLTPDIEEILNESGIETENERSSYADSLEGTIEDLPERTSSDQNASAVVRIQREDESDKKDSGIDQSDFDRNILRKSLGDDPGIFKLTEKAPSQDDIDRISKVRINSPLVSKDVDKDSLGRKTLDSLMEIERNRLALLEEQGCQVIEHEREKISQLKRRIQNETKQRWEEERDAKSQSRELEKDAVAANDQREDANERLMCENDKGGHSREHSFELDAISSTTFADESSGVASSSIEELQSRSTSAVRKRDGTRPVSDTSEVSNDNARSSFRVAPYWARSDLQRPLTRYLPIDRDDLDLRQHIESAGHQVALCPHVLIDRTSCRGYLHKLGAKFHAWSKRWFVFDRESKTFIYYSDKSERKPRGGAYFQVIEEVYLDHGNQSKSPSPQTTFVVKTRQRRYYLMSPSGEAARIWIDVIFTGAQGYLEYLQ